MGQHGSKWVNMGQHGLTWVNMGQHGLTLVNIQCLMVDISVPWSKFQDAWQHGQHGQHERARCWATRTLARVFTFRGHFAVLIFNAERNMRKEMKNKFESNLFGKQL